MNSDGQVKHRSRTPATLDAYEVLRQFIDGTDEMESCFIAVVASREFLTDERRGLNRYDALKLRIWDEVRDRHRQNPFASLIRVSSGHTETDHCGMNCAGQRRRRAFCSLLLMRRQPKFI